MKVLMYVSFLVMCVALCVAVGCTAAQVENGAKEVQNLFGGAAPLIPPPFGLIASGVASLAGVVGSIAAGKVKGTAVAAGLDPHPVATFFAEHQYLYPALSMTIGVLQNLHVVNISGDQIGAMMAVLGLPLAPQFIWNKRADAMAPEVPSAVAGAVEVKKEG